MTWKPTMTVIGIDGLPSVSKAGNVCHPKLSLRLSIRTPPTLNCCKARDWMIKELTRDPPYNAKVKVDCSKCGMGFNANEMSKKFSKMVDESSKNFFG